MKEITQRLAPRLLFLGVLLLLFAPSSWSATDKSSAEPDGFSIYLSAEGLTEELPACRGLEKDLRKIRLQSEPFISSDDVITYNKDTHEISLDPSFYGRLMQVHWGTPFVVCVGNERIYSGFIWSRVASTSCDSVVIKQQPTEPPGDDYAIQLELGYVKFTGTDLRSDPRILRALEKAGKLENKERTEKTAQLGTTIPQTAPIVNLLSAIKSGDSAPLKSVWSKRMIERINPEGAEETWEEVLQEYSEVFKHYYGDFELEDFRFSFEGDETKGKLITDFKGERAGDLQIIKEGSEWKMDER
jgi:hypothetical protein